MKNPSIVDHDGLLALAHEAMARAYAPYSDFKVGAALLTADDQVVVGCNIENASYGLTICAERSAIATAVARGERKFRAIAIVSSHAAPCTPCGACRQVLSEFEPDLEIVLERPDASPWVLSLRELLPHQFNFDRPGGLLQAKRDPGAPQGADGANQQSRDTGRKTAR